MVRANNPIIRCMGISLFSLKPSRDPLDRDWHGLDGRFYFGSHLWRYRFQLMTLLCMSGDELHEFSFRFSPHLKAAACRRIDIKTAKLFVGFRGHDRILLACLVPITSIVQHIG